MKRPLVMPTLVYAGGVLLGDSLPLALPWLLGATLLLALATLRWPRGASWWLWPLLLGAGWTNQVRHTALLSPHDLRHQFHAPALVTVRGRLTETPYQRVYEHDEVEAWRTIAQVEVRAVQPQNQPWAPAFGVVAVTTAGVLPGEFFGGRQVEITGVLRPPQPPTVPGGFDYPTYLRRQGIYFQLRADGTNDWRLAGDAGPAQPPVADRFVAWAHRTLARGLPVEDEPLRLLWTMTLGWKTGLTGEVSEPFMRSGTMHIFAISGLHIALIAGILVSLLRVLQVPRGVCGLVVIPLIWFYTGVTGWQASAIRSTVMMTIVIAGWSLRRPSDLLNSLAAAAFIILLWDPQQIFQASFQLSFGCVLALALFTPIFQKTAARWLEPDPLLPEDLRPRWQRWLARPLYWLAASLATSLAAWVGSMPLIAHYFNLFTPVSLLANLIVVPLSGLALTSNLASLLVGGWFPAGGELFNHSAWLWMWLMVRVSQWSAALPGGCFHIRGPSALTFVLYYATVISLTAGWLAKPRLRFWRAGALALVGLAWLVQWQGERRAATLAVLPLSGGHAIYGRDPGRRGEWLVDCGSPSAAEFSLKPFLRWQGINRLERLLLTHGDTRQVGGTEVVTQVFRPRQIFTSPLRFRSPAYRKLVENPARNPDQWRTVQAGDPFAGWTVLHPEAADRVAQADDGAVVLLGDLRGTRVLLLSDLGRAGQETLRARHPDLAADIVVAGLPAAGEPLAGGLLEAIHPALIVIADSEYPALRRASPKLRERLAQARIPIVFTRDAGAVQFTFRPGRWELQTMSGQRVSGRSPMAGDP